MEEEIFVPDLLPDEKMLWTGRPDPSVVFSPIDIFLVPFSLFWGGFAFFWEGSALKIFANNASKTAGGFVAYFPLFGIPFVAMGLYFIVGRFIYKRWRKRRTWYGVTNRRVLIVSQGVTRQVQTAEIRSISSISKTLHRNGLGTIRFGNSLGWMSMYQNTGMEFFGTFYGQDVPSFFDIKDVEEVYRLVSEQKK